MSQGRAIVVGLLSLAPAFASVAAAADRPARPIVEMQFDRRLISGALYSLGLSALKGVDDLLSEPPALLTLLPAVRFDTSFVEKEMPVAALAGPRSSLLSFRADLSSRVLGGALTEEAEFLGFGPLDPGEAEHSAEATPRLVRLALTGRWGGLESGIRAESITTGLEGVTASQVKGDQEGIEAWLAARLGAMRLRGSAGDYRDNVVDDARRGRTRRTQAALAMELTLPAGSVLALGVSRGVVERISPLRGVRPGPAQPPVDRESVQVDIYHHGGATWDVTLASAWAVDSEPGSVSRDTVSLSQQLGVAYRPTRAISVTPALDVWSSAPDGATARTRSVGASLSVGVAPLLGPLDLSLYGGYRGTATSEGAVDSRALDATASLVWNLLRSAPRVTLAFEAAYHRYVDAASAAAGYEEVVGQLVLKIGVF